jgi:hypothetical protein
VPGGSAISDGERAIWTGGGRAAHYREKAAHFKELASAELQPRARAQLLGLAFEYDQLAEARAPKPSANTLPPSRNKPGALLFHGRHEG